MVVSLRLCWFLIDISKKIVKIKGMMINGGSIDESDSSPFDFPEDVPVELLPGDFVGSVSSD